MKTFNKSFAFLGLFSSGFCCLAVCVVFCTQLRLVKIANRRNRLKGSFLRSVYFSVSDQFHKRGKQFSLIQCSQILLCLQYVPGLLVSIEEIFSFHIKVVLLSIFLCLSHKFINNILKLLKNKKLETIYCFSSSFSYQKLFKTI